MLSGKQQRRRRDARRKREIRVLLNCPSGRLPSLAQIRREGGPPHLVKRKLAAREEYKRLTPKLPPMRSARVVEPPPPGRWLYRIWSANDRLLYIGITDRGRAREREHARTKLWWSEVHHITYERVHTRAELRFLEAQAIRQEHPKYNVQHNR